MRARKAAGRPVPRRDASSKVFLKENRGRSPDFRPSFAPRRESNLVHRHLQPWHVHALVEAGDLALGLAGAADLARGAREVVAAIAIRVRGAQLVAHEHGTG